MWGRKEFGFQAPNLNFFLVWVSVRVYNGLWYHLSMRTGTYRYTNKRVGTGYSQESVPKWTRHPKSASGVPKLVSVCADTLNDAHRQKVICRAWYNDLTIPKEISLSLEKLTRNRKRGRPRKLGGHFTFDDWIAVSYILILIRYF